jgi:hypothetical protein
MNDTQKKELINKLWHGTQAKRYEWVKNSNNESFRLSFPNSSIILSVFDLSDPFSAVQESGVTIKIISREGSIVERLTAGDFDGVVDDPVSLLNSLYELVRDQVLGLSETIQDIFENL